MTESSERERNPTGGRERSGDRRAVLGLPTDAIGDLQVSDLVGNVAALKMLLHKYSDYIEENRDLQGKLAALQTELKIYTAYRDGYGQRRSDSRTAATLSFLGTVLVGFGTNLSTPVFTTGGTVTLGAGAVVSLLAVYFSLRS